MALKQASRVSVAALLTTQIFAIGTNDQVNQTINYGTFQNPSNYVRPRFRYWVPDASANLSQIGDDIKMAGAVGAGGVELLGYHAYGDSSYFDDIILRNGLFMDGVLPLGVSLSLLTLCVVPLY